MARLQLESATDILDLDAVFRNGKGVQARSGATGLGLPPKQVQWLAGAGDGAKARGRRVLPRDMDLPLFVTGDNRDELKSWLSRLAMVLAGTATLRFVEDDGSSWFTTVEHVGGGNYVYGVDTVGERDFFTVITLRSGDPYWTYSVPRTERIKNTPTGPGLLGVGLVSLNLASSQAMGNIDLENIGDAEAYPVWTIIGPGQNFKATSPTGEKLEWLGSLAPGEKLVIDTRAGTVRDNTGVNRYAALAPAPRFWKVPPGTSTCNVFLENVSAGSEIQCTWRPRKWMVV